MSCELRLIRCWVALTVLSVCILEFKAMRFAQRGCNYTVALGQHKDTILSCWLILRWGWFNKSLHVTVLEHIYQILRLKTAHICRYILLHRICGSWSSDWESLPSKNKQWLHCRKWQFLIANVLHKWLSWYKKLVIANFLFLSFFFWCIILLLITKTVKAQS